jgi:hypothetical protein
VKYIPTKIVPKSACVFSEHPIRDVIRYVVIVKRNKEGFPVIGNQNSSQTRGGKFPSYVIVFAFAPIGALLQYLQFVTRFEQYIESLVYGLFKMLPEEQRWNGSRSTDEYYKTLREQLPKQTEVLRNLLLNNESNRLAQYASSIFIPVCETINELKQMSSRRD